MDEQDEQYTVHPQLPMWSIVQHTQLCLRNSAWQVKSSEKSQRNVGAMGVGESGRLRHLRATPLPRCTCRSPCTVVSGPTIGISQQTRPLRVDPIEGGCMASKMTSTWRTKLITD